MEKFGEWITSKFKHPLSPMFFFLGVLLILLGVSNGVSLPVFNQLASDPGFRWVCLVLGVLCFAASLVIFYRPPGSVGSSSSADDRSKYLVHQYSGVWKVHTSFSRWRNRPIIEPDQVSFDGKTLLIVPMKGDGGSGVQVGKLRVRIGDYRAAYDIVNEVQRAFVDATGTLKMQVVVIRRQLIEDTPPLPNDAYADLRGGLENRMFDTVLEPAANAPDQLIGSHTHKDGRPIDQAADEEWGYAGLFNPPGLDPS